MGSRNYILNAALPFTSLPYFRWLPQSDHRPRSSSPLSSFIVAHSSRSYVEDRSQSSSKSWLSREEKHDHLSSSLIRLVTYFVRRMFSGGWRYTRVHISTMVHACLAWYFASDNLWCDGIYNTVKGWEPGCQAATSFFLSHLSTRYNIFRSDEIIVYVLFLSGNRMCLAKYAKRDNDEKIAE